MRAAARHQVHALLAVPLAGCSLVSLDGLQDFDGRGGGTTESSPTTSSVGSAETITASSGDGTTSSVAASNGSASSTEASSASQSGAGGAGTGGGAPTDAYAEAVLSDGPIAYLRLDEEAGDTEVDDSVGPYDGTLLGGVTWREPGAIASGAGTSLRFDGTSGALVLGDVLDFTDGAPFSFELWARIGEAEPTGLEWLFSKEVDLGAVRQGYSALVTTELQVGIELWVDDDARVAYSSSPAPKDTWTHVVVTSEPGQLLIYLNGVKFESGGEDLGMHDTEGDLTFAAQSGGQGHFDGWLDEIAVYDHALTPARITAHRDAAQ